MKIRVRKLKRISSRKLYNRARLDLDMFGRGIMDVSVLPRARELPLLAKLKLRAQVFVRSAFYYFRNPIGFEVKKIAYRPKFAVSAKILDDSGPALAFIRNWLQNRRLTRFMAYEPGSALTAAAGAASIQANPLSAKKERKARIYAKSRFGFKIHSIKNFALRKVGHSESFGRNLGVENLLRKVAAGTMILGMILNSGAYAVMKTSAYFNDTEGSLLNLFGATSLDFELESPNGFTPNPIVTETDALRTIEVVNQGDLGFKYTVRPINFSGDAELCENLGLKAKLHNFEVYSGRLLDFVSPTSTFDTLGIANGWDFTLNIPSTAPATVLGKTCNFDFVYEGWQTDFENYDQGFSDVETISNTITSREKLPPDVCPFTEGPGKYIVHFKNKILISNPIYIGLTHKGYYLDISDGPVPGNLPAGNYDITLASYDDHHNKPDEIQDYEQWKLVMKNSAGEEVGVTQPIRDIVDATEEQIIKKVETNFAVSQDINSFTAMHSHYPDSEANSVYALCAMFEGDNLHEQDPPTPPTPPTPPDPGTNLIVNPGFETGASPWVFYTNGSGDFTADSPGYSGSFAAKIQIENSGTNVQLFQSDISLISGKLYRLTFDAYSNTGHDFSAAIFKHGEPYTNYGLSATPFAVGTSWNNFSVDFIASATANDARLMFWLAPYAEAGDEFFIDNVALTLVDPGDPAPTPVPNIISNPSFETGTDPWVFYTNGTGGFTTESGGSFGPQAGKVSITTPGTNVQLYQPDLALESGQKYRLTFDAYSNIGSNLSAFVIQHGSPYENYGLDGFTANLTNSWQSFSVEFIASGFSGAVNDARLMFWFADTANAGDEFFIDNVALTPLAQSSVALNEFLPRPSGVEYSFDFGNDDSLKPAGEWVELYNNGADPVDLSGWYIWDASGVAGNKIYITTANTSPAATQINGHDWIVVYMNQAVLDNTGDAVRLYNSGNELVDFYSYGQPPDYCNLQPTPGGSNAPFGSGSCLSVPPNKSYARIPDGTGAWVDPIPTPGRPNVGEELPLEEILTEQQPVSGEVAVQTSSGGSEILETIADAINGVITDAGATSTESTTTSLLDPAEVLKSDIEATKEEVKGPSYEEYSVENAASENAESALNEETGSERQNPAEDPLENTEAIVEPLNSEEAILPQTEQEPAPSEAITPAPQKEPESEPAKEPEPASEPVEGE